MSITPGVEGLRFRQLVDFLHRSNVVGRRGQELSVNQRDILPHSLLI